MIPNCAGYGSVFKARQAVHIRIFAACRNAEDGPGDKQVGIIIFFPRTLVQTVENVPADLASAAKEVMSVSMYRDG
jgi:hypothetical protein